MTTTRYYRVQTGNSTYYVVKNIDIRRHAHTRDVTTRCWRTDGLFFHCDRDLELKPHQLLEGENGGRRITTSPITNVVRINEQLFDQAQDLHNF